MAETPRWAPSAGAEVLAARASLLADIRGFFAARGVLEVETPLLCSGTVTDPALVPIPSGERWLQTSPEYAMKRLLAAGSGPIYQICKAFRAGEAGGRHNPEFTLLEWYRPGYSLEALIEEVGELIAGLLNREGWQTRRYGELFKEALGIDPHTATVAELEACARDRLDYAGGEEGRDTWLDLLMSHVVEPALGSGLVFVRDYPASQAALAQLREESGYPVAERFELYVDGVELANGYLELTDAAEQAQRFGRDNARLREQGARERPLDQDLLAALEAGMPDCSGVALGVDRLLMLQLGLDRIDQVISFDWSRS